MIYYLIIIILSILLTIYWTYALIKGEITLNPRIYLIIIWISSVETLLRNVKLLLLIGK